MMATVVYGRRRFQWLSCHLHLTKMVSTLKCDLFLVMLHSYFVADSVLAAACCYVVDTGEALAT